MKLQEQGLANRIAKFLARPLSSVVANPMTESWARLIEAYWCILLGKGSGSNWSLKAEVKATQSITGTTAPVLLDVGANFGEWSLLMNRIFPQAQILLVEPQPCCQQVILERRIPNATLLPYAVSSTRGGTRLYVDRDKPGIASLYPRRDSYFQSGHFAEQHVDTITIDEIVTQYGLSRVDFMKMDIEGHELHGLQGSIKSLESHLIRALSFEFGACNINSRTYFHDFWDLLHPLGYRIYRVLPSARLLPISEYYEDCEYFRGVSNYFAVAQ